METCSFAPMATACLPLGEARPSLPQMTLLHAGPALKIPQAVVTPMLNAAIAAALYEHWAPSPEIARQMIFSGEIALEPAQNYGVVTPLACVVSASMPVLQVVCDGVTMLSPLNDGPAEGALRFGVATPEAQVARLALMARVGQHLAVRLHTPVELLALLAAGIARGDDLHGSVAGFTQALADTLAFTDSEADAYARTPLFGLNWVMAASATLLRQRLASEAGPMVIATGGNGRDFGWQTSDAPGTWVVRTARPPVGPRFDGKGDIPALPAIGDSAVIDAAGFGAAILRHAPALTQALAAFHPKTAFNLAASRAFVAKIKGLPADIRTGLPAAALQDHPGIMLAIVGAQGEGLIGRGIAPWPKL